MTAEKEQKNQIESPLVGREIYERAEKVIRSKINDFREKTRRGYRNYPPLSDRSVLLAEILNKEGDATGFVTDEKFRTFNIHPTLLGEIILLAMQKFTPVREETMKKSDRDSHSRKLIAKDVVPADHFALIRTYEVKNDVWISTKWELVDTAPEFMVPNLKLLRFLRKRS